MALSGSFKQSAEETKSQVAKSQNPSGRRKQLYILYLLNDLLHHGKHHIDSSSTYSILIGDLRPFVSDLCAHASAYELEGYAKHHKRIQDLLDLWDRSGYYQPSYIGKLRETVASTARLGFQSADETRTALNAAGDGGLNGDKKDAPYIMPASHGDLSMPFYDLPAANMLPHIMPNSATPINPQLVKPLQFTAGPADESLAAAVKDFLRDVDSLDEVQFEGEGLAMDIDELGQCIRRDKITGDITEGEGYYGWSRGFCERMNRRGAGAGDISKAFGRYRSIDRDLSPLRRNYSDSDGRSRSRTWSRDKKRRDARPSTSRSRSRSPSREPKSYRSLRSRSRSMSRSSSYSPPPVVPAEQRAPQSTDPRPLPRDRAQGPSPPQPVPFGHPFPQGFPPLGPDGLPIPPPPPPNYKGPWPPPPPPPPTYNSNSTGLAHAGPTPPLPTGPRTYQNQGPSFSLSGLHNSSQGETPQDPGSWGQIHQQSGAGVSFPYGGPGRSQPPFSGRVPNGRGGGNSYRGWAQ